MKKLTIVTAILSLIFVPVLLDSCHSNNICECCDVAGTNKIYSIQNIYMDVSSNGQAPQYRVTPKHLRFGFTIVPKYTSMTPAYKGTMGAYASCAAIIPISAQKFASVKITCDQQLVTTREKVYQKGDDISNEFLSTGFTTYDPITGIVFSFTPNFSVYDEEVQVFFFKFTLDDGSTYSFQSDHFQLIKDDTQ